MAGDKWSESEARFADLYNRGRITEQQYLDAVKNAKATDAQYAADLKKSTDQLKQSISGLGSALISGKQGASVYNDSINGAAGVIDTIASSFGIFGKILGTAATAGAKYITAVNEQADQLFETYQDISRTGLATGMDDVFSNLQNMGYTMKEVGKMGALLKENSRALANFGGTAAQGAKQFSLIARDIEDGDTSTQLKMMGMTVDDINQGTAGYIRTLQTTGALRNQTNAELARGAEEYIKEQDRLAKLTGMNAKKQNDLYQAALVEQNFGATQAGLQRRGDTGTLERNKELFLRFSTEFGEENGPEYSKAFMAFASNSVNSPEYKKFLLSFPEAADMIKSGKYSAEEVLEAAHQRAKKNVTMLEDQGLVNNAEKNYLSYNGMVQGAQYDQAERAKANTAQAKKEQKDQIDGKDPQVKTMVELTTSQRNQTQAFQTLLNDGITPVTDKVRLLTKGIEKATSAAGSLAGRKERMGGEASGPPSEEMSKADPTKIINFTGRTGDLAHFKQLQPSVYNSFLAMAEEYFQTSGKKLQVNSAYRSPEEQAGTNSGNNPKAAPGKSLHQQGKAVDINSSQRSELASMGLLGKHGFKLPPFEDPPHIEMPQAAKGGILSGPLEGYTAKLHGTEAVIPMGADKTIKIDLKSELLKPLDNFKSTISEFFNPLASYESSVNRPDSALPAKPNKSAPAENKNKDNMAAETENNAPEKQELDLLSKKIAALDMAISGMIRSNDAATKILQRQS